MEVPSPSIRRGYLYAFLAAICGGAIPTLSKLLLVQMGPVAVSGLVFLLSGLMLLPLKPLTLPSRGGLKWAAFFGLIGAATAPVLYQIGLNSTTAVNASLLANGEVLFTALIAFSAFGERLGRTQLARGLLIVAGIIIVSTNLDLAGVQLLQGLAGNILILGATFFWSIENNLIIGATRRFGASLITKYRNIIGGGVVVAILVALGTRMSLNATGVVYLVLLSMSMAATSYLAIVALADIGAVRMILVFSTTTIFGAIFALVFLREQITVVQILGGALILVGAYTLQKAERKLGTSGNGGRL